MAPLVGLLPVLGSTVVKAMLTGRSPSGDAWVSFSEKLLGALVAEQATTVAALERIEAKLDRVAAQPHEIAMGTGHALLRDAQRNWRSAHDLDRLLHEARVQYLQAASAAKDSYGAAYANVFLAMTWLLMRSARDCQLALAEAARLLEEEARKPVPTPSADEIRATAAKHLSWESRAAFFWQGPAHWAWKRAEESLKRADVRGRERAISLLAPIQRARRLLGVSPEDARIPALAPPPSAIAAIMRGPVSGIDLADTTRWYRAAPESPPMPRVIWDPPE